MSSVWEVRSDMEENTIYQAGIDIGSTTVKLVITDCGRILFGEYRRHHAHTQQTLASLLKEAKAITSACSLRAHITGSGSIGLSKALGIPFTQEVVAVADAIMKYYPHTDVAIELGGEDAKIIYFKGGLDERMNGVCAGGTGSFIDQMAALLQTDAEGLNEAAKDFPRWRQPALICSYEHFEGIYSVFEPILSRNQCSYEQLKRLPLGDLTSLLRQPLKLRFSLSV